MSNRRTFAEAVAGVRRAALQLVAGLRWSLGLPATSPAPRFTVAACCWVGAQHVRILDADRPWRELPIFDDGTTLARDVAERTAAALNADPSAPTPRASAWEPRRSDAEQ